ncbi:hypothetical protein GCM10010832_02750 [Psychroflexus planctonicus]|uniref:Uncharacterized protein n=1 Tax=Psychroflexus planctonicus TaxID=1526575 RepID=A0ABQ1SDV8_9FLAO|nr:hypothetical protein GCM10010832_02750 [Psychroflexus planctonicus]
MRQGVKKLEKLDETFKVLSLTSTTLQGFETLAGFCNGYRFVLISIAYLIPIAIFNIA